MPGDYIQQVLPPPGISERPDFVVAPWQLGHDPEVHGMKGKSNTVWILDVARRFLENPYNSTKDPLDLLFKAGAAEGSPVEDFSLRHNVGFSKSIAAKLILDAAGPSDFCAGRPVSSSPVRSSLPCSLAAAASGAADKGQGTRDPHGQPATPERLLPARSWSCG